MFSRSEKTEEVLDVMDESSGERSPMVLAALAGLLAIAGAFLLVWYLNSNGDGDVASSTDSTEAVAEGGSGTTSPSNSDAPTRQVLVVTTQIPRGTSVNELIAAPTVYLSARAVPEEFVTASALTSVAELQELRGLVLASDALPGEQLLRGRFRDPSDFDSNDETFLEAASDFPIPEGHHAVVIEIPASRALGGNIRPGELITVIGNSRLAPDAEQRQGRELSVVILNQAKVIGVQETIEVAGSISQDFNQVGTATLGSFRFTIAVKPEELTDLTYAIGYLDIVIATAVDELDNDGPRAATTIRQVIGDDGVWLGEAEDGNIIELLELFLPEDLGGESSSIEIDLPTDGEDGEAEEAGDEETTELVDGEGG